MRFRIPEKHPESFPFSQFRWRRVELLGFLLCHCCTLSSTLPADSQTYKEGRDAADSPGYCSSRTGGRAVGYRRFIQHDARVWAPFVAHWSGASMTVETDRTAIYSTISMLNEQLVVSSHVWRTTLSYKPINNFSQNATDLSTNWIKETRLTADHCTVCETNVLCYGKLPTCSCFLGQSHIYSECPVSQ